MTRVHGYRIGKWYGLLSAQWVALLPPSCADTDLGRTWLRAQGLRGDQLLEALTSQLNSQAEPFALVIFSPDADADAQVYIRGPVQVALLQGAERTTLVGGNEIVKRELAGVTRVELRAPGAITSGAPLPLDGGVVRVETIAVSLGAPVVSAEVYDEVDSQLRAQRALGGSAAELFDDHTLLAPTLGLTSSASDEDHTVLSPTISQLSAELYEDDDDDTLISPRAAAFAMASNSSSGDPDHDGHTVMSSDLPQLRAQLGAATNSANTLVGDAPQIRVSGPRTVVLSTGQIIALNRPVLIGRSPSVSRVSASTMPRLVSVPSPKQDISRTHVEIRQDGDVILVTDLSSTNGTILHVPGLTPRRLYPGMPTLMENDDIVDLGDGVTIKVEA